MNRASSHRLTWFILGLGVVVTLAIYVQTGTEAAISSGLGVAIALANWYLLRVIVARVVGGEVRGYARFTFLVVVKMVILLGLIFVLLRSGLVQPLAFTIGISSLALGTLLGSFVHVLTARAVESER
jgi:hypothetical protein